MARDGLNLRTPRTDARQGFVGEFSEVAQNLNATQAWQGGFLLCQFTLIADPERPEDQTELINAFNTWLKYDLTWQDGGELVFNGLVCQMELVIGRTRRRRSMIDSGRPLWNAVRAQYDNSGTLATTAYATVAESIARYGRIEKTLTETAESTSTIAAQFRDMVLSERGWPSPYTMSISRQPQAVTLDVMACGYIVTADWQDASVTIATTDDVSNVIEDLITTDCPELTIGYIEPNTLQVAEEDLRGSTPRQQIAHLVSLGDASGNLYRAYVGADAKFYYVKVSDLTPEFYLTQQGIRQRLAGDTIKGTQVHPGIMRDTTYPVVNREPGSIFLSGQDMLITEVKYNQGQEFPDLRTSEVTDVDLYAAKLE